MEKAASMARGIANARSEILPRDWHGERGRTPQRLLRPAERMNQIKKPVGARPSPNGSKFNDFLAVLLHQQDRSSQFTVSFGGFLCTNSAAMFQAAEWLGHDRLHNLLIPKIPG